MYIISMLTKKQKEVLLFIMDFIVKNQASPTLKEMSDHFNWSSPNAALCHIKALVKKGFISYKYGATKKSMHIVGYKLKWEKINGG